MAPHVLNNRRSPPSHRGGIF